jgi:OPT oligopeptide transporter protein
VSTFVIGATLNVMNKGLEEFRDTSRGWDISVPHDGVQVQQQHFEHSRIHVIHADKTTDEREAGQYTLLNSLGSHELADGKYLYNPNTHKIEVQWIQGIGSEKAAAPQARLMATVISGILSRKLPWGLVLLGVFLVIAVELLGIRSLSFAVGAYLSIATTLAIFCGGVVRWMVDRAVAQYSGRSVETESEVSPGSLYASGLIAAGGIVGLMGVALKLYEAATDRSDVLQFPVTNPLHHDWVSVLMFALLAFSLYYFARKPLGSAPDAETSSAKE